jgi:hypothetical protein
LAANVLCQFELRRAIESNSSCHINFNGAGARLGTG